LSRILITSAHVNAETVAFAAPPRRPAGPLAGAAQAHRRGVPIGVM
jgi:hypothetical protein